MSQSSVSSLSGTVTLPAATIVQLPDEEVNEVRGSVVLPGSAVRSISGQVNIPGRLARFNLRRVDDDEPKPMRFYRVAVSGARNEITLSDEERTALTTSYNALKDSLLDGDEDAKIEIDFENLKCYITRNGEREEAFLNDQEHPDAVEFRKNLEKFKIENTRAWPSYLPDSIAPISGLPQLDRQGKVLTEQQFSFDEFRRQHLTTNDRTILNRFTMAEITYNAWTKAVEGQIKKHTRLKAQNQGNHDAVRHEQMILDGLQRTQNKLKGIDCFAVAWAIANTSLDDDIDKRMQAAVDSKKRLEDVLAGNIEQPGKVETIKRLFVFANGPTAMQQQEVSEKEKITKYAHDVARLTFVSSRQENDLFKQVHGGSLGGETLENTLIKKAAEEWVEFSDADVRTGTLLSGLPIETQEEIKLSVTGTLRKSRGFIREIDKGLGNAATAAAYEARRLEVLEKKKRKYRSLYPKPLIQAPAAP